MKLVKSLGMALGLLAAAPASATYIITGGANYVTGSAAFTLEVPDAYAWTNNNTFSVPDSIITAAHFVGLDGSVFGLTDTGLEITVYDDDADLATGLTGQWEAWMVLTPNFWVWNNENIVVDINDNFSNDYCSEPCDFLSVSYRDDGQGNGNVPEPATLALIGLGLAGLGFSRRQRKHVAQSL